MYTYALNRLGELHENYNIGALGDIRVSGLSGPNVKDQGQGHDRTKYGHKSETYASTALRRVLTSLAAHS